MLGDMPTTDCADRTLTPSPDHERSPERDLPPPPYCRYGSNAEPPHPLRALALSIDSIAHPESDRRARRGCPRSWLQTESPDAVMTGSARRCSAGDLHAV